MKKKNGFIATSLIYSFFLVFITLFLTIIADHLQNKVLLNTIERDIKEEINNTKNIKDFLIGDKLTFQMSFPNTVKCGADINNLADTFCSTINSATLYEVISLNTVGNTYINTLGLKNTNDNSILYVKIDASKKISIENSNGIITITGVSS